MFFFALEQTVRLTAHRTTLREHIAYHNLFTLYAYLVVEFATVVRPRVSPPLTGRTVDTKSRLAIIADKDSSFSEERLAVLPSKAFILIHDIKEVANPSIINLLNQKSWIDVHALENLNAPIFFVIDPETKSIRGLGPSSIAQVLAHYPHLQMQWPFPPNVHRHFIRSWLFNRVRLAFDALNYLMGHKHFGSEPYHSYASTNTESLHAILSEQLDHALSTLGITPIRFQR